MRIITFFLVFILSFSHAAVMGSSDPHDTKRRRTQPKQAVAAVVKGWAGLPIPLQVNVLSGLTLQEFCLVGCTSKGMQTLCQRPATIRFYLLATRITSPNRKLLETEAKAALNLHKEWQRLYRSFPYQMEHMVSHAFLAATHYGDTRAVDVLAPGCLQIRSHPTQMIAPLLPELRKEGRARQLIEYCHATLNVPAETLTLLELSLLVPSQEERQSLFLSQADDELALTLVDESVSQSEAEKVLETALEAANRGHVPSQELMAEYLLFGVWNGTKLSQGEAWRKSKVAGAFERVKGWGDKWGSFAVQDTYFHAALKDLRAYPTLTAYAVEGIKQGNPHLAVSLAWAITVREINDPGINFNALMNLDVFTHSSERQCQVLRGVMHSHHFGWKFPYQANLFEDQVENLLLTGVVWGNLGLKPAQVFLVQLLNKHFSRGGAAVIPLIDPTEEKDDLAVTYRQLARRLATSILAWAENNDAIYWHFIQAFRHHFLPELGRRLDKLGSPLIILMTAKGVAKKIVKLTLAKDLTRLSSAQQCLLLEAFYGDGANLLGKRAREIMDAVVTKADAGDREAQTLLARLWQTVPDWLQDKKKSNKLPLKYERSLARWKRTNSQVRELMHAGGA